MTEADMNTARAAIDNDTDKAKHHTISTGAVLLNWFRQISNLSRR
jgi:hypothetical protein